MPRYTALEKCFIDGTRRRKGETFSSAAKFKKLPSHLVMAGSKPSGKDKLIISDNVRIFAEANTVDLSTIEGTGKDGRITKGDVAAVITARNSTAVADDADGSPGAPLKSIGSSTDAEVI